MNCPACGHENPNGAKFCNQCAGALPPRCLKCGASNPAGSRFCNECAAPLGSGGASPSTRKTDQTHAAIDIKSEQLDLSAGLDGERKTVTALFADIKGSMELMEDLDPEEARAIVDPALKLMIDAVHRYGGYIVQSTGDGIFALFGAPIAHEDHPQRALLTALRLQEQLGRYSSQLRGQGRMPLQARVGINTGDVVVRSIDTGEGHTEYTPIGHSTSLAARIQTLAPVGSIATTDTTRKLCEGYFSFRSLGPTIVKGVSDPIEVFEVAGLGPLRTRFQRAEVRGLTKFVGRQREMEALKHAGEGAQAGDGQFVAVMADPGIGKSRLFYEFKAFSQSSWTVLEAFSVSYGKASAYLPVLDLLSAYFEISRDDDERKRRERILGKVLGLDRSLENTLPYLYSLFGIAGTDDSLAQMDPHIRRRRTQEAIKGIVLRESLNKPLMVIFEDLHWIDSETQALLDLLVDAIANARVLLLANYRPEYRHEWTTRTHYTLLRLDPLGRESAGEMLSVLLGDDKDLNPLKRQIVERTQGTPFFMEEMVQALFEHGVLQRNAVVKLAKPMNMVKVPATVQAVLASRIDRLPAAEKELLQILAVLGREFPLNLVKRVTDRSGDELEQIFHQLELGEFIFEQAAASDATQFIFKHALTQEVAYDSILLERRRPLHERAADVIEQLYAAQPEDHYNELAHHYLRSKNGAKAIKFAKLAAEQAMSRAAYAQAASLVETALKLLDNLSDGVDKIQTELALRRIESTLAFVSYGASSKQRERAISRICELGERIGGSEHLRALTTLSGLYETREASARGLELARQCLTLVDAVQADELLVELRYNAGMLARSCGHYQEAVSHLKEALYQAHRTNCRRSLQWGLGYPSVLLLELALGLQCLGRVNEAARIADEGLGRARESRHMLTLGAMLVLGSALWLIRRQPEIARAYCEEAIVLSEEAGFAEWLEWARCNHGRALCELGRVDQGLAEMETAIAGFRRLGGVPHQQYQIAVRAEFIASIGRVEEALAALNEALANVEASGGKGEYAEMLRLKGEALLMRDRPAMAEAEECFRQALDVTRAQESKWWELRTSASLARLLRDSDRRDQARTMLTEIYNWFTEGFDLPDLQEAKALLDELSG